MTLLAFLLALFLGSYLLNLFNSMAGTSLSLAGLLKPEVLVPLVLLLAFVMLAAGAYPAMILSSFRPSEMLSGRNRSGGRGGAAVQRLLVFGQFAVSIFLVVCTLVVFRQLNFMKGRSLGFERADKIVLEVKSDLPAFQRNYASITEALRGNPAVTGAAVSSVIPGVASQGGYYLKRGESYTSAEKPIRLKTIAVDPDYLDLYGIRTVAGRLFRHGYPRGSNGVVRRQRNRRPGSRVRLPQDALGARFTAHYNRRTKAIIGVVKDVHFMGMKDAADPIIFDLEPSLLRYITLSAAPGRAREAAAFAERVWRERFPGVPFEYELLDETFSRVYGYEEQMGSLLGVVTGLGLTAAFLGLLGLVSFYSRQRRKEIAIRKTIGAPNAHIVVLLSRRFAGLISLAGLLAVPAAWWSANAWLRGFAYRIEPGAPVFLFSLGVSLLIAMTAILFQGMKASRSRPADVLRHE